LDLGAVLGTCLRYAARSRAPTDNPESAHTTARRINNLDVTDAEVLIAGAGPIGLTAAIELARRGIACRIVDPLLEPPRYAKAVGVQPRTLEVFEGMGVLRRILDHAILMRGQVVYVNGEQVGRMELTPPADVPFGFISIPQYVTERILREELATLGVQVERGLALQGFEQDADGVTATVNGGAVRVRYLIGADGAHSLVRKSLGLSFEGGVFDGQYMLGDVEVDWSMPTGYGVRASHQSPRANDGTKPQVGIGVSDQPPYREPLLRRPRVRGRRCRAHPSPDRSPGDEHGHPGRAQPGLEGRTRGGGQRRDGLLDSYDAERRPVGEEVVGRTVRSARAGIGADSTDPEYVIRREAQLLIDYAGSPIVAPGAGGRAPDLTGRAARGRMDVYVLAAPDAAVVATTIPMIRDAAEEFAKAYGAS
jgi:hypothetical protein